MPAFVAIDNEFVTVQLHPEHGIVHHRFKKFIFGERFREALTLGVELMEKHGATKWLSDDRSNGALSAADSGWATAEWSAQALRAGWKAWAVVLPEAVIGQMNMRRFVQLHRRNGVEVRVFTDPEQAMEWLRSVAPT